MADISEDIGARCVNRLEDDPFLSYAVRAIIGDEHGAVKRSNETLAFHLDDMPDEIALILAQYAPIYFNRLLQLHRSHLAGMASLLIALLGPTSAGDDHGKTTRCAEVWKCSAKYCDFRHNRRAAGQKVYDSILTGVTSQRWLVMTRESGILYFIKGIVKCNICRAHLALEFTATIQEHEEFIKRKLTI